MSSDPDVETFFLDGDPAPIADGLAECNPIVMFPQGIASDLGQRDVAFIERILNEAWTGKARRDQTIGIDPDQREADLHVGAAESREEMSRVVCQAIEILRGVAASIGLRDGCEGD